MKNKKILIIIFSILLVIVLLVFGIINLEKNAEANEIKEEIKIAEEETEDYNLEEMINENIDNKSFELLDTTDMQKNYCNEVDTELISDDEFTGILSIIVEDFDNNGNDEAITLEIAEDNLIYLKLYKGQNDELIVIDTYQIDTNNLLNISSEVDFSLFAREVDDQIKLYCEMSYGDVIFDDTKYWEFLMLSVNGNNITEEVKKEYIGTTLEETEETEIINAIQNNANLNIDEIGFDETPIVFQLDDAIEICNIARSLESSYKYKLEYGSYEEDSEKILYGYTTYSNYMTEEDYRINFDMYSKVDVEGKKFKHEFDDEEGTEYSSIIFADEKNVTTGVYYTYEGTYEVNGNRIVATYTTLDDGLSEKSEILEVEYYRIVDGNLISNGYVYEEY